MKRAFEEFLIKQEAEARKISDDLSYHHSMIVNNKITKNINKFSSIHKAYPLNLQ